MGKNTSADNYYNRPVGTMSTSISTRFLKVTFPNCAAMKLITAFALQVNLFHVAL